MKTSLVWNCHPHNEASKSPVDSPKRAASSQLQEERRGEKSCADREKRLQEDTHRIELQNVWMSFALKRF